ncbi:hypothetical protein M569_14170, partial [Genlisea aurea]
RAHEAEEEASRRVAAALAEIEAAKESELESLRMLEEAKAEMDEKKKDLEVALEKSEIAEEGKLGMEQELRKWRAEHRELRRKADKSSFPTVGVSETDRSPPKQLISPSSLSSNAETDRSGEMGMNKKMKKKKKKSFLPRMLMFLGRKSKSKA